MGVPKFFEWLLLEYPQIDNFDQNKKVDSLYFDWTYCLNLIAKKIINEHPNQPNIEVLIIKENLKYLDYLINIFKLQNFYCVRWSCYKG